MENYNGFYEQRFSVILNGVDHEACLAHSKIIKHLCRAWFFNVRFYEYKSNNKGEILSREIMIIQTALCDDILSFRESLRCICFNLRSMTGSDIRVIDRGTMREGDRIDLINKTIDSVNS